MLKRFTNLLVFPLYLVKLLFNILIFMLQLIRCKLVESKKKHVLVIPFFSQTGGMRDYTFQLLDYLSTRKYKIDLLLTKGLLDPGIISFCKKKNILIHVSNSKLESKKLYLSWFSIENLNIISSYLWEFINISKYYIKLKPSTIVISAAEDILLPAYILPVNVYFAFHAIPGKINLIKQYILNHNLSVNKQLISVSENAADIFKKNWINSKMHQFITCIHNYYDPPSLLSEKIANQFLNILTLGHVVEYRNPMLWINIVRELKNKIGDTWQINFIWAGEGPLLDNCRLECKNEDYIRFIGHVTDITPLMQQADIYFQPSLKDNHSLSIIQAMCFGLPIVASNVGGNPESVINGFNGYTVDPENELDFIHSLTKLIENQELRKQMGANSVIRYSEYFTKECWYKKMDNLLSNTAEK